MVEKGEFLNRIRGLLKIYPRGLTITEISQRLKCNRNSVAKYLESLQISGVVEMQQMGAAKVFFLSQRIPISSLLGFTKEGILVIADDGRIIQVNERFCRMFDQDVTSITGISYLMLPPEILSAFHFETYFNSDAEIEHTGVVTFNKYDWRRFFKVKYIKTVFDDGRTGLTVIVEDVTLETEMEERLRISEARYRGIVEDQTELICRYGMDGTLSFANGAFCRLFHMNPGEVPHHSLFDFIKPDMAGKIIESMRACSLLSPVSESEFEFNLPSGRSRWYHWVSRMLTDECGEILEFQGVGRDITERKNAERELLIKSHAMDSSIVPIALLSLEGSVSYVNRAFLDLWEYQSHDEVLGLSFDHLVSGFDTSIAKILSDILLSEEKGGLSFEVEGIKKDGTQINLSVTISGVYDPDNNPVCFITYLYDVTRWVRLVRELEIKDTAIANSYEGMAIITPDDVVMYVNPSYKRIFSRVPEGTLIGRTIEWNLSFYPRIIGAIPEVRAALNEKGNYTRVFSDFDENGSPLVVQVHLSRVFDRTGTHLCTLISALDITSQRSMEESLALMIDQLEGTVDQMGDPTFIVSRDQMVVAWNDAMETLTGLSKREAIGTRNYQDLLNKSVPSLPILVDLFVLAPKELIQVFPKVSRVGSSSYTEAFIQTFHGGDRTYVWVKASPISDAEGRVIGHIQTIKNMTNWKRAVESVAPKTVI